MLHTTPAAEPRPLTVPSTNTENIEAAYRAISELFKDPAQPSMRATGDIVRHGSDGIESPVLKPQSWQSGNYIQFQTYSSTNTAQPLYYCVSGTGPNGEYIPPHRVDHNGQRVDSPSTPNQFKIYEEQKMIKVLDLQKGSSTDEQGREYYTRPGFSGRYYLQQDEGGQVSVHYTGGTHSSGVQLPPQTFVNGSWDLTRREPVRPESSNNGRFVNLEFPRRHPDIGRLT